MEHLVLKREIVEKIENDTVLFGKIADVLNVKSVTLPQILAANKPRLTQATILKVIREHLEIEQDTELLCELQESPLIINKTVKATA